MGARAKAREARKEARRTGSRDPSDIGVPLERVPSHISTASHLSIEELGDRSEKGKESDTKKKEKEMSWFMIENPSRVTKPQLRFLAEETRYHKVGRRDGSLSGIIMIVDQDPSAPADEVIKVERVEIGQEEEADMPEP